MTCPDRDAHADALKSLANEVLTSELSADMPDGEDDAFVAFGSVLGTGLSGFVIDNMLNVENYFVCSIGRVSLGSETRVVSVGLLNHVFTADSEDVKQMAGEIFN